MPLPSTLMSSPMTTMSDRNDFASLANFSPRPYRARRDPKALRPRPQSHNDPGNALRNSGDLAGVAAAVVSQGRKRSPRPMARIQVVTVLRPRARTAPRNSQASRGADRRSRPVARRENHWHGTGIRRKDVMAGPVRGDGLAW
jgi:hypothetical protein